MKKFYDDLKMVIEHEHPMSLADGISQLQIINDEYKNDNLDEEEVHILADMVLLSIVNDPLIHTLFDEVEKWYS